MPGLPTDEVGLILFAIQSAIKVGAAFQKSYIDATTAAPIMLPLPNFPTTIDSQTALTFFSPGVPPNTLPGGGNSFVSKNPVLAALVSKAFASGAGSLTDDEAASFQAFYTEDFIIQQASVNNNLAYHNGQNPASLTSDDIASSLTIRQWPRNPNPSMLQALAGTFIDIGVQYLATMPGAVSPDTNEGKALRGFLQTASNIDFATEGADQIVQQLFLATVQTIKNNPAVIAGGSNSQALVSNVLSAVYDKAQQQIAAAGGDFSQQDNIRSFAQMLMSTALSSTAKTVFDNPGKYLGVGQPGQAALISAVAGSLMDSLTNGPQINLRDLLTPQTLQGIVQSALKVVGQHPEILGTDNKGLTTLVTSIATTLSDPSVKLDQDAVPQLIQSILASTAENFSLLVPDSTNPAQNLLTSAAKEILTIISAPPPAGAKWTLKFTSQDSLQLANFVFSQVVGNPDWLVDLAGGSQSRMGTVVQAVLSALQTNGTVNLTKAAGLSILQDVTTACASRLDFFKADPNGKLLLNDALDATIGVLFNPANDPAAKWLLLANDTLPQVVNTIFQLLTKHGVTQANIAAVTTFLQGTLTQIANGAAWSLDTFASQLEATLEPTHAS